MKYLESENFYIFGAGSTAKLFKSILDKQNKKITAILTSEGENKSHFGDIEIIDLSKDYEKVDHSIPIIIAVFNREKNANIPFIIEFLSKIGLHKIITPYDFYQNFSDLLKDWYWLTDQKFYRQHKKEYQEARCLFDDDKSLDTFDRIIHFLSSFDSNILPSADAENQYFPKDIQVWNNKGAFLDIGSFDGQTLLDAYKKYGKIQTAIAYEPDPQNISQIKTKIEKLDIANQIFFIPCGVWSKTETLSFSSGGGESSSIQDDGDITIQCLSIDETLLNVEIGYIKMDIEGAEFEALLGAQNTIKKYKPTLAISLYHKPNHLFAIPLLINSWGLGYKFAIRSHGNNLFETVLYCY